MIGRLEKTVLDCPDPAVLARFYAGVLGGEVDRPDGRWGLFNADGFEGQRIYMVPELDLVLVRLG